MVEKMYIYGIDTFTDNVLQDVGQVNSFKHLKEVGLNMCDNLSMDCLESVLLKCTENTLETVMLRSCAKITKHQVYDYKQYLLNNGFHDVCVKATF
jgi:hypothetical protein